MANIFNPGLLTPHSVQLLQDVDQSGQFGEDNPWKDFGPVDPNNPFFMSGGNGSLNSIDFEGPPQMPGQPEMGPVEGRGGETPRERQEVQLRAAPMPVPGVGSSSEGGGEGPQLKQPEGGGQTGSPSGNQATPPQPRTPSPNLGGPSGVMPFKPLPQTSGPTTATPRLKGLYGSLGGLQGGGLGVPQDPVSNYKNDPIEFLMSALKGRR